MLKRNLSLKIALFKVFDSGNQIKGSRHRENKTGSLCKLERSPYKFLLSKNTFIKDLIKYVTYFVKASKSLADIRLKLAAMFKNIEAYIL